QDCDCSVCWFRREMAKPAPSRSTPCAQCRPAYARPIRTLQMGCVGGIWKPLLSEWKVERLLSARNTRDPPDRRNTGALFYDSGKPTPYVPIHERPYVLAGWQQAHR